MKGEINKLIHEPSRLKILVMLASSLDAAVPFTVIKDQLSLTAGNLSIQLKTLEEAGFISIQKEFVDNKPKTSVCITKDGKEGLFKYMTDLENLLGKVSRT
ncbi:MAG TPA: transcriptional regulator [Treponemataceae bacterium]|jgi:DNA-binding MarR family transcriptional regulator|nr:transcriptional regulator [Treponemataceae bacterium]HQL04458.1 transcriptional regulator [Treponemataceae bacterium]